MASYGKSIHTLLVNRQLCKGTGSNTGGSPSREKGRNGNDDADDIYGNEDGDEDGYGEDGDDRYGYGYDDDDGNGYDDDHYGDGRDDNPDEEW